MSLQDNVFSRGEETSKVVDLFKVGPDKFVEVVKTGAMIRRQVVTLFGEEVIKTPSTNESYEAAHAVIAYNTHCYRNGARPSEGFHVGGWHVRLVALTSGFWGVFAVWDRPGFAHVQFFAEDGSFEAFTQSLASIGNPFSEVDARLLVRQVS